MIVALLRQIVTMFILMFLGYFLFKRKLITNEGATDIGKILLYLVIPIVVFKNFCIERSQENMIIIGQAALLASISMALAVLLSYLIFGKKDGVSAFSSSFSNVGFIGIPLISAVVGQRGVFYISIMVVLVFVLQWTLGIFFITGDKSVMSPKKVFTNPVTISVVLGLGAFFFQIPVSDFVLNLFDSIGAMNTPLAMIVTGVYLAQAGLIDMWKRKSNYFLCLCRLLFIPLLTVLLFRLLPFGSYDLKQALLIAAACPVGSNVAIFANQYDKDYRRAVEQVCMSTLLCLPSLPLVFLVMEWLFGKI